jgi:cytochrome c oxidase assembly protein Cox11
MDKSKTTFVTVIMILVFMLGVGYALVNSVELTIQGTGSSKTQELDVVFKEETTVTNEEKVVATTKKDDTGLAANLEVKDLNLNETVSATYTIQNKEVDVSANLVTTSIANSNPEYFQVTTNLKENEVVQSKNGELDIEISVKLIKTPLTKEQSEATITITFNALPVASKS